MAPQDEHVLRAHLRDLLVRATTVAEFKRVLRDRFGERVVAELPADGSALDIFDGAVNLLGRRGYLTRELLLDLIAIAPRHRGELEAIFGNLLTSDPASRLNGFELVQSLAGSSNGNPKRFYMGNQPTWADLVADVDVRRSVLQGDRRIEYEALLDRMDSGEIVGNTLMVFGEAGAGKTTFLRRLMFDLAMKGCTVHRCRFDTRVDMEEILTYARSEKNGTAFLFFDDVQQFAGMFSALGAELANDEGRLCIVGAARKNEWNRTTHRLRRDIDTVFLSRLTEKESKDLVSKLDLHDSLGRLKDLAPQQRLAALVEEADKQLLVGLLEATQGRRFRDIVIDEFDQIPDTSAKFLYMAVCYLSHLRVQVVEQTAQIISNAESRLHLEMTILPALELVLGFETTDRGLVLVPRHRAIGDELVAQRCPKLGDCYNLCQDILRRTAKVDSIEPTIQSFVARLGERMSLERLIPSAHEAERTIDQILSSGSGTYRRYQGPAGHSLQAQRGAARGEKFFRVEDHPTEYQFRAAAKLALRSIGPDEAINIIQEALHFNDRWLSIRFDRAMIEWERGNIKLAEELIHEITLHASLSSLSRYGGLPTDLAVDIARFRGASDVKIAKEYLDLAEHNVRPGMLDRNGYFQEVARCCDALDKPTAAVAALRRGMKFVVGPPRRIEEIAHELAMRAAPTDPRQVLTWIRDNIPEPEFVPDFLVARLIVGSVGSTELMLDIAPLVELRPLSINEASVELIKAGRADGMKVLLSMFERYEPSQRVFELLLLHSVASHDPDLLRLACLRAMPKQGYAEAVDDFLRKRGYDDAAMFSAVLCCVGSPEEQQYWSVFGMALAGDLPALERMVRETDVLNKMSVDRVLAVFIIATFHRNREVAREIWRGANCRATLAAKAPSMVIDIAKLLREMNAEAMGEALSALSFVREITGEAFLPPDALGKIVLRAERAGMMESVAELLEYSHTPMSLVERLESGERRNADEVVSTLKERARAVEARRKALASRELSATGAKGDVTGGFPR